MKQRLLNLNEKDRLQLVNDLIYDYDDEIGLSSLYDLYDPWFYDWWFENLTDEEGEEIEWDNLYDFIPTLKSEAFNPNDKYVYIRFYGDHLINSCNDPYEALSPDEIIEICGDKLEEYL